jgi:opacity protein-like surface antigen
MRAARVHTLVVLVMVVAARSHAQDAPAAAAPTTGRMDVQGAVDVGYRWTDVNGSTAMYRRLFDLSDGARLMSVDVSGAAPRDASMFADAFGLSVSGVGDPFPAAQFSMRKRGRYDLRVNWRRSRFRDTWPLTPTSIGGLDTRAVTDFHAWSTSRNMGNVAFAYDVDDHFHVVFNYSRISRSGDLISTRSLDFIGAPAIWGTFARANPYQVTTPVDDSANRIAGGISYSARNWTLNYQTGYQKYDESQALAPLASPERSINVADATTAGELLSVLHSSQSRRLTSPLSELSFVFRPASKVEWRGEYLFYRYKGPFNLTASYQGMARTNSTATTLSPYNVSLTASGTATSPNNVLGQTLTYHVTDQWALQAEYRYSRFSMDSSGRLTSTLANFPTTPPGPTDTVEEDAEAWRQGTHTAAVLVTFDPSAVLTVRGGGRFSHRDVEHRVDGVLESATSEDMNTFSPEVTVAYRPTPKFTARGSYRHANSDTSYTRLSPDDRTIAHLGVRIEPRENLVIEGSVDASDASLDAARFLSRTRFGSLQASYKFGERVTAIGGIDYQSFLGRGNVSFLRGVAPIADDEMVDRERDRIWLVGAVVQLTSRLGFTGTANFVRTTGTDTIAGEPPLYGPVTFPYGTGSVYYDLPRVGRISVDLQRTRFEQEILFLNDFRATLLTLRFSRGF